MIQSAFSSRGGHDHLEYRLFKKSLLAFAQSAVDAYSEVAEFGALPASLLTSNTIFVLKVEVLGAALADLKPLSLNKIVAKIVPAILPSKVLALSPQWCRKYHHGCGHGCSTATALGDIEGHLWWHSRLHPQMAAPLRDVKVASPSLRRSWLRAVLKAGGCPPDLLWLFDARIALSYTWLVWKGAVQPACYVREGIWQGCPWRVFFSLLDQIAGLDGALRNCLAECPWLFFTMI